MQQKITIPVFSSIKKLHSSNSIFITDENIFLLHTSAFKNQKVIVIKAGDKYKTQATVTTVVKQLINLNADKTTTLIGVGGGVVTDITGYIACVYMRGISFGFVPTTLLAMVDASIGGKNGINFGLYKNFIGTTQQPQFIINDLQFLKTLPQAEWQNGFAEIIKHACIKNITMFGMLQQKSIAYYKKNTADLQLLIQQNIAIKNNIIKKDIFEKGDRKLLNFGHTLGHAIENLYQLSHGQAIAVGMNFACKLSEVYLNFKQRNDVNILLQQYELPINITFNKNKVFSVLQMDKKRQQEKIHFILLEKIGKAKVELLDFTAIKSQL